MTKEIIIKSIFIILFIIATYVAEIFYRDPLYDNSIEIAKTLQGKLPFLITPLKIYSTLGILDFLWVFIIFLFFPINYCFTFFLNVAVSVHICNYMKLLYGQGRPFLINGTGKDILKACEAGYGNPSGHSFQSTSNFLALAQIIIDFFKLKMKSSIFIYIVVAILILLINFSKVILGVHSINQIIFGDTLGFCIYFIFFQIIKPYKIDIDNFLGKFLNIRYHIINAILFIVVLTYILMGAIYLEREEENSVLKTRLELYCGVNENQMLTRNSIIKSFYIMSYFGMICGLTAFTIILKNRYNYNFNAANYYYRNIDMKWYKKYGIRFLIVLLCFIPYPITFLRPKYINKYLVYVFCSALPMFLFGFFLFGLSFLANILLKVANKEIYSIKSSNTLTEYNINLNLNEDEEDSPYLY